MAPRLSADILPQASAINAWRDSLAHATTIPAVAACARQAQDIALALIAAEAGATLVTTVLSRLNDAVTERILALIQSDFRLPPTPWCWLGLGSEGRLEQTLATDQDNGLMFSASDDGEARELRTLFLPFARAVNTALADCGFPLCDGVIMAGNPQWCLSQAEWQVRFTHWVRTPEPEALLNAAIFFDFRPITGDAGLADDLRDALGRLTRGNDIFLRMMAVNALAAAPPLGRFRDFVTVPGAGGAVDLKKFGSRIFVDAARILALATGGAEAGTVPRLTRLAANGSLAPAEAEAAIHAFHALQGLRLTNQAAELGAGRPTGNLVHPDTLNDFDRRLLRGTLRQAGALQQRLKTRFQIND